MPFFSICIPAYKNVNYLKRLLNTVFEQTFTDYEVIITDDSPDERLKDFLIQYYQSKSIGYYKNPVSLGTPDNWNEAISKATGEWIKLMHDDDWFCTKDALQILHDAVQDGASNFYFSAYNNVFLDENNRLQEVRCPAARWKRVMQFPPNLYARNIIGPPSVTLIKNGQPAIYDKRMKWLVDIDYYISLMKQGRPVYIPVPLVNVGMSSAQVTAYTHNKPHVEIPEGLLLLSKIGEQAFKHILYYDAWWRLLRNLSIRNVAQFEHFAGDLHVPQILKRMIYHQKSLPAKWLRLGILSKTLMVGSYLISKH